MAKRIGELLVEAGVLSQQQLEQALFAQRKDRRRLGQLLIELGLVGETKLTQTLSRQLSVPWVSLYHVDFSRALLNLVPRALAEKYSLVPIFLRKARNQEDTLYVAMDDPTREEAIDEVTRASSMPVRPMIACPSDIHAAIRVYYLGESVPEPVLRAPPVPSSNASAVRSAGAQSAAVSPSLAAPSATVSPSVAMSPSPNVSPCVVASPSAAASSSAAVSPSTRGSPSVAVPPSATVSPPQAVPPSAMLSPSTAVSSSAALSPSAAVSSSAALPPSAAGRGIAGSPPPSQPALQLLEEDAAPESSPELQSKEGGMPVRMRPRTISLTLLDGTTISVPAPKKRGSKPDLEVPAGQELSDQLTARDLVSALRAVAHGADASEILGTEPRWEAMFSALLSILLRRGLIADWEFIEEFRKI